MQIACPACKTRISVPDDKIKPQGTKVKCGKCAKVFTVKKKTSEPKPEAAPAAQSTSAAAAKAAPPPEAQSELDKLFGEEPPAAVAAPSQEADPADELGLGYSSAPVGDDDSYLGGDNFGAEMDNYKTQLRPMAGRDGSLFGSSSDLDGPGKPKKERTEDLFGSSDDLFDDAPAPKAADKPTPSSSDVDSLFDREPPRAKTSTVMPSKENLDDLFGKGLDNDGADEMVSKLLEAKPSKSRHDDDDLFGPRDPKPERTSAAAAKLDTLFDDEPEPVAPKRERAAAPLMPKPSGPSAEELAATMNLEPALKDEDLPPRPAPVKAVESKATASAKRKFPVKVVVWVLVLLLLGGGGAAAVFVPAVNTQVKQLVAHLPIEKITALLETKEPAPVVERIEISATVNEYRMLTGGRGDLLFVVTGTVTNNYPNSRSFIKVQGKLLAEDGTVLAVRDVFAGNVLSDEQIRGLERVRIDGMLNRSVGDGLQNFNVPSGKTIPYQIVFYDVDKPVHSQSVHPVSSEPGN